MTTEPGTDVYYKKTIPFNFSKQRLRFRVSQDLFSSHDIDVGSRFLLRTLVTSKEMGQPSSILDLGCGYGPIGLTLKSLHPEAVVHLTDRDALAVEYTRQNAELNGLQDGVEVYASLGYDDLRRSAFDLIVSNIPGKAGQSVISDLLLGAVRHLVPGGLAAVVVVSPLESLVAEVLAGRDDVAVVFHERKSGHVVSHYRFLGTPEFRSRPVGRADNAGTHAGDALPPGVGEGTGPSRVHDRHTPIEAPRSVEREGTGPSPTPGLVDARSALERGVYRRQVATVGKANLRYSLETAFNLPEFESPSYATEMLFDGLRDLRVGAVKRAVLFNPGQGHAAVALWTWLEPGRISLVDRDLLALRYATLNLLRNGCEEDRVELFHQVGLALPDLEPIDLTMGVLREDEGQDAVVLAVRQAAEQSASGGRALLAGGSTGITRVATSLEAEPLFEVVERRRRSGHSLLVLRKP